MKTRAEHIKQLIHLINKFWNDLPLEGNIIFYNSMHKTSFSLSEIEKFIILQ
jgi:hypothetical protein